MIYNDLFKEYIDIKSPLQSPREILNKYNRHKNHIQPIIGNIELSNIKYKDCQKIVNEVIYTKELSHKTAKNVIAVVKAVLNYAIKNEYIEKNVANFTEIPNFDNKYDLQITKQQIKDLIDNIISFENSLYSDIFVVALHGRRKTEILSLQWFQIDFSTKTYFIPPQKNKSRKYDVHTMTNLMYERLYQRYLDSKQYGLNRDSDYVFISPHTGTYLKDVKRPFKKLKHLSGVDRFRFHDFRHLLCSYTLNNKKLPIEHISQALGHSSIEVTQKYLTKDSNISCDVVSSMLCDFGIN